MADEEDPADAALRLEAALERIARLTQARNASSNALQAGSPNADVANIAARLDALIAQLGAALGKSASS